MPDVIYTVNGPGELHGIALPLARALRIALPTARHILFTVPCQFSSGFEASAAQATGVFDTVFTVPQYTQFILKQQLPEGYTFTVPGLVFYCGGDTFHALKIAQRLGYPAYAYNDGSLTNASKFKKVFSKFIDGDLMVDAAAAKKIQYQAVPIGSEKVTVGLYPGTRIGHLQLMVPFLSELALTLKVKYPQLNFRWGIADSVKPLFIEQYQQRAYAAPFEQPGDAYDVIVSLIGTNTAITGALGIPMVVLLPFNDLRQIPLVGLFGLLSMIPGIGILFKKLAVFAVMRSKQFVAIPNRKAKRMIVPELKGVLTVLQVATVVESLLINIKERENMHHQLPIFMGKPAAEKIAAYCKGVLQ